ncbi:MAG: hypothetical protein CL610_20610 [Anaerolineaceae bacterium]|nr:hypothetical protein [Anaerolineaceae bacterium]
MISPLDEVSALIEQRTGLSVATRFRNDLQHILNEVAGNDLAGLCMALRQSPVSSPQWQAVVQALTIGETYFFRDASMFRLLRSQVLLPLIKQRREAHSLEINIWCAGCATGEEPYSLAITLLETLPDLNRWTIRLIGTDINAAALEQAQAGLYRDWAFRHCPAHIRQRYFEINQGEWRIRPEVCRMVTFQQANLLDQPPLPNCDLILCRNVLIYVARGYMGQVETSMYNVLAPGGWLILGPSEAMRTHRERWITHVFNDAIFYQKSPRPQPTPVTRRHTPHAPARAADDALRAAAEQYHKALTAVHNDQPDEAERLLVELLSNQPDHAQARTLLAFIFASRQALPEAHAHLDAALRSNSLLSDAHYLRATLYLEAGEDKMAEQALRAALYCQRDHPLATFLIGSVYARTGDLLRAQRAWAAAQSIAEALKPEARISDLSDMTVATFATLVQAQLDSLQG